MTADLLAILDQLDEARAKATPGPWQYDPSEGDTVWDADKQRPSIIALTRDPYGNREDDAALIVAAVNAAPKLTAALRAVLELTEQWRYKGEFGWGPWQEGHGPDPEGHVLDDATAEILAAITATLAPEATS